MSFPRRLVPVVLLGLVTVVAFAADDPSVHAPPPVTFVGQPVALEATGMSAGSAAATDPAAGVPDIPANRSEIDALRAGKMTLERPAGAEAVPAPAAAATARRAAFDAVIAAQQAKIQALKDRLATAAGDDAVMAIQQEIALEKQATQRQLLELQLEFATRDGDQARVEMMNEALTAWDAPQPVLQPVDRPVPTNPGR
jgi:hypothetical protein